MTAATENIALMRGAFDALNRKDLDACIALLTSDFVINLAGLPIAQHGPKAWRKNAERLFSAFSDAQIHVEDMFASEDKVAVRAKVTGTHTGEFMGKQPTGKRVSYQTNELYRVVNGKIAEEWICSDTLTMMTQIDVIPAKHLIAMWFAGKRIWFGAVVGLVIGVFATLLLQAAIWAPT